MGEHEQLAASFKKVMEQSSGTITFEQERIRLAREKREGEERAARDATDAETAERERQARIAASKALAPGIPMPVELPTVTYDPVTGRLVKVAGGPVEATERLLGVEIQG